eukprot:6124872-Prymnesium_polylepis.1
MKKRWAGVGQAHSSHNTLRMSLDQEGGQADNGAPCRWGVRESKEARWLSEDGEQQTLPLRQLIAMGEAATCDESPAIT